MRNTRRARIILLAADGLKNQEIAKTLGTSGNSVGKWRRRFVERGVRVLTQKGPLDANPENSEALKSTVMPRFQVGQ